MTTPTASNPQRRVAAFGFVAFLIAAVLVCSPTVAPAQDLQSQLSPKRSQLEQTRTRQAALSTTLERYSHQIKRSRPRWPPFATARRGFSRELDLKTEQLRVAKARLARLRARLRHALNVLRQRLVAIYESDMPDIVTVILDSRGFDDLGQPIEYLTRIQRQDTSIVGQVPGFVTRPAARWSGSARPASGSPPSATRWREPRTSSRVARALSPALAIASSESSRR